MSVIFSVSLYQQLWNPGNTQAVDTASREHHLQLCTSLSAIREIPRRQTVGEIFELGQHGR